jgi:hypothetical protein
VSHFLRGALFLLLIGFGRYLSGQAPPAAVTNQQTPANSAITSPPSPSPVVADTFPINAKPLLASQFNGVFYVDGFPSDGCTVNSIVYTTQLDCAVASVAKWLQMSNSPAVLMLGQRGSGRVYETCTGITIPQIDNRSMSLIGNGTGGINQPTTINQICPINHAMIYKDSAPAPNLNQSIRISGIKLWGGRNASSCMDLNGLQGSIIENIFCAGGYTDSAGEDAVVYVGSKWGTAGWVYETTFRNITIAGAIAEGPAKIASIQANMNDGKIATDGYTVKSPGGGYIAGDHSPIAYLWGFGAGANPCKTMPKNLKANIVNGGVESITSSTPAEGCGEKIDVIVMNDSVYKYGMHFRNATDCETENLVVRGSYKGASIAEDEAPINNLHPHVYGGQYVSFKDYGGEVWDAPQIDTPGHIGFYVDGPGTTIRSPLISANGAFPDGIGVLLGPHASETNLSGSFFCYPTDKSTNWVKVATSANGPLSNGVPAGIHLHSSLTGTCDSTASASSSNFDSGSPQVNANALPYSDFETSGAKPATDWSQGGTYFGINSTATFNGNFLDFRKNGISSFSVASDGSLHLSAPPILPPSYKVGGNSISQPAASGTIALTSQLPLSGTTPSWDNHGAAIKANSCVDGPVVSIAGATNHAAIVVTPALNPGLGLSWANAYVANGSTVQVVVCNLTAAPIAPSATSYNVRVIP